jgi:glycosyltransferase involved in cell wall biosynthesis
MRILHVFRAPVGGLFRHVRDLARGQSALGHEVGLLCDANTGGEAAKSLLETALPYCALGIHRIGISRLPGLGDAKTTLAVRKLARRHRIDIMHGHGAKGGLYARLAALGGRSAAVYTPHGGSLHYDWTQATGAAFLAAEWLQARMGSGSIFVCEYERRLFERKLGTPDWPSTVVHNGLWPEEFAADAAGASACDFVFIGELRAIKGVDVLIEALALLAQRHPVTASLVGDGPQQAEYMELVRNRGLGPRVDFAGRLPTLEALSRGRTLVLPSRAESFPYVVLEAAAQGKPIVASSVGGIPEILPPDCLVAAGDAMRLATRLEENLLGLTGAKTVSARIAERLQREFNAQTMAARITDFYARAAAARQSRTAR